MYFPLSILAYKQEFLGTFLCGDGLTDIASGRGLNYRQRHPQNARVVVHDPFFIFRKSDIIMM
jgi:hypothetical protein